MKFAKFVGTALSQSTTGRLFLIATVSIVVKGELANKIIDYSKEQSKWKNRFQKQSFADFKLGVLKNFLSFTRKHLWKVCNSINNRLQHSRFPVKFANVLRTPFLQSSFSGYLWGLTRVFKGVQNKEQKPVRLSAINTIFKLQRCICCHKNSEAATVGVS